MSTQNAAAVLVALLVCVAATARNGSLEKPDPRAVVATISDLLTANYIFPERATLANAKIASNLAAGDYAAITDRAMFAQQLTADLRSVLHDKHVVVIAVPTAPAGANPAPPVGAPTFPPSNAGFTRVDRLKGNIGYIKILGFAWFAPFKAAVDQAMADLAKTDALIIDLRDSGGGSAESETYFCSFFFDPQKPVHLDDFIRRIPGTEEFTTEQWWTQAVATPYLNKPVYLLTSKQVFSGGEAFVYDLKVQKRIKVFGETTGGGANPGRRFPISPLFSIFIPTGRPENPLTKTNWDGVGITPDVPVDQKQAFQVALLDLLRNRADAEASALKSDLATQYEVDPFVEAHLLKVRTTPLAGGAAAARRYIEELGRGQPNYALISPEFSGITRSDLPALHAQISKLGAIKAVTFNGISPYEDALDVYDVTLANGSIRVGIFVTPDGRIASAWVSPTAASTPVN